MELQQLHAFSILAHYENMQMAAQFLNTSQPQVSKLLSSLEAELGVHLFDRVGRGIRLNEHGKLFIQYANDAISVMQNGQLAMHNLRNSILGTVTIGTFAFGPILNPCVLAYSHKSPHVNFRYLANGGSGYMKVNHIDILLCPSFHRHYNYKNHFPVSRNLFKEDYYMLIPRQLREYPAEKNSIDLYETQNFPYIVMGQGDNQKNNDYNILQDISNTLGITPRIAYEVNEFVFKMLLVSQGVGVTFLPQVCLPLAQMLAPDARIFAIENFPTTRSVLLARKKKAAMSPAANDFWDFALDYYQMPPDTME